MNAGVFDDYALHRRENRRLSFVEVAQDIICLPFLSGEMCQKIVIAADEHGGYQPYENDLKQNNAPGMEIRLPLISKTLGKMVRRHIQEVVLPVARKFWWPVNLNDEPRTPFVLKCSTDGQPGMMLHHDSSVISFSIRLNTGYTGGELWFPRQRWTNRNVPVGSVVIFPGSITHVHGVRDVVSGRRYGITGWVGRPKDDFDLLIDSLK